MLHKLDSLTCDRPLIEIREAFRRISLSEIIWNSILKSREAEEAWESLQEYSDKNQIPLCSLIKLIINTNQCHFNKYIDKHIETLIRIGYFLVYGDPLLEEEYCNSYLQEEAKKISLDILSMYIKEIYIE